MSKTVTATLNPVLVEKTDGDHMGHGYGDGRWVQEEHWIEIYNNRDGTYTKKIVKQITKHTIHEEDIHIHKSKENMSEKEYFKRKLSGDLYGT